MAINLWVLSRASSEFSSRFRSSVFRNLYLRLCGEKR